MSLDNIQDIFDFDNFDYFYHETSKGDAQTIMQQGLLVDGTNIIDTNNILFTTASPITEEMVTSSQQFIDYIQSEASPNNIRDVSAMVILAADKENNGQIVDGFGQSVNGVFYQGIIYPEHVVGYLDMCELEFHPNENYEYAEEFFGEDTYGM